MLPAVSAIRAKVRIKTGFRARILQHGEKHHPFDCLPAMAAAVLDDAHETNSGRASSASAGASNGVRSARALAMHLASASAIVSP